MSESSDFPAPDPTPMTEAEAWSMLFQDMVAAVRAEADLDDEATDAAAAALDVVLDVESYDALAVLLDWHELGKRATPEQLTALLRGAEEAGRSCPCDAAADSEATAQRYLGEYEDEVRELSGQLERLRAERAAYLYALRTADAAMGAALRGWSKQSADALFHAVLVIREATRHSDEQRCHHGYGVSEFCAQCRDDECLPDEEGATRE